MSLATRCPHCKTIFHVSEEQLRMRAGTVRCGVCRELFNGIDNLAGRIPNGHTINTRRAPYMAGTPVSSQNTVNTASATKQAATPPSTEALKKSFDKQLQSLSLDLDTGTEPAKQVSSHDTGKVSDELRPPLSVEKQPSSSSSDTVIPPVTPPFASPVPSMPLPESDTDNGQQDNPSADDLFQTIHRRKRKSRIAGIFWLAGSIALAIVLCGQIIYHYSSNIVAWWPPAKGLLGSTCEWLSCPSGNATVSGDTWHVEYEKPVPVENAPGQFTQTITMFHDSDSPKPWPALVVEITGTDNQIISRRVIEPGEYLAETQRTHATWPAGEKNHIQLLLFIEQPLDTAIHSRIVPLNH